MTGKTGARPFARPVGNTHIAAIHALKGKLGLTDDDYRALLANLTGKTSSLEMTLPERARVRAHLQRLVGGPAGSRGSFAQQYAAASPKQRKVWVLWNQLHRQGRIGDNSARALNAWVKRQTGVDALQWANSAQLDSLIEALKDWGHR